MLAFILGLVLLSPQDPSILTVPVAPASEITADDLTAIATDAAQRHGLHVPNFIATFKCKIKKRPDGTLDYTAQSDHIRKDGIRENSWGMWQINLDAHPTITKEQAQDPLWSTEWAANEWAEGRAWQWTCWKSLGK